MDFSDVYEKRITRVLYVGNLDNAFLGNSVNFQNVKFLKAVSKLKNDSLFERLGEQHKFKVSVDTVKRYQQYPARSDSKFDCLIINFADVMEYEIFSLLLSFIKNVRHGGVILLTKVTQDKFDVLASIISRMFGVVEITYGNGENGHIIIERK